MCNLPSCIQVKRNSCSMDWNRVMSWNKMVLQDKTTDLTYYDT